MTVTEHDLDQYARQLVFTLERLVSPCEVIGCDRIEHARGLCGMHHQEYLRKLDDEGAEPTVTHADWRAMAACYGRHDIDWLADRGNGGELSAENALEVERAKAICSRCPVMDECLRDALASSVGWDVGIRGCTTKRERNRMRREGRP